MFFFWGMGLPERFAREAVVRSPVSQVAGAIIVSLIVHLLLVLVYGALGVRPNWDLIIRVLVGGDALVSRAVDGPNHVAVLAEAIRTDKYRVALYALISSLTGLALGYGLGVGVVRQWPVVWMLSQHRWLFELRLSETQPSLANRLRKAVRMPQKVIYTGKQTIAAVLTTSDAAFEEPKEKAEVVLRGPLLSFSVGADGVIRYVVLIDSMERFYLRLSRESARTTVSEALPLGASMSHRQHGRAIDGRYIYIPGPSIRNIVFEQSTQMDIDSIGSIKLKDALAKSVVDKIEIEKAMKALGSVVPGEISWRVSVFAWEGEFLKIRQRIHFKPGAPELGLLLALGEGVAGAAAATRSFHDRLAESKDFILVNKRNVDLATHGDTIHRVLAVPIGEREDRKGVALAVISFDFMEKVEDDQAAVVAEALKRAASVIEAKHTAALLPNTSDPEAHKDAARGVRPELEVPQSPR